MMRALKGVRHLSSSTVKQAVSELCIPVPWGEIRGKVWGPDHGRPVLCLHGWSDNCGTFDTLIPLLPKDCKYMAVDMPGHGFSSHRPPGVMYSFPMYVMDVRRIIDALHWSKFSIIGHSMGGNIAAIFSALYPEKVDALILLDTYGFIPEEMKTIPEMMRQGMDDMIWYEKQTEEKKRRVYTFEKAVQRLLAANPCLSEQSANILLTRGLVQVEGGVAFTRDLRINLKNIVRITLEQCLEMQSRIKASTLVVMAEDGINKTETLTKYRKKVVSALCQAYRDQNHTVMTVPGDHHVHLNDPRVIATVVSDFLRTKLLVLSDRQTDELTSKL